VKRKVYGSHITSDAGLLAYCAVDYALKPTNLADNDVEAAPDRSGDA